MKTINEEHRNVIETNHENMHSSLGDMDTSLIPLFFTGKSIFITGATGFMGKVLVEKLLRSCPNVKSIFVLLRSKKNVDPIGRLNELIKSKIFDRVREINPDLLNKIIVVPGDIVEPGLGISIDDTETLIDEVSIVFHSAATVKFDEPMGTSINFNALGTRHILELCAKMKRLEALVHVSTAYSNCNRYVVEEKFYPIDTSYKKIIELVEWMDDETLEAITPKLLGDRPNTYTFTKALAENLLFAESNSVPVAIVRPSIVTAAWREPYPGWVDNINGPTGMILAFGKGLLRTMLFNSKACADLIPVDIVINLMITVAWYTATKRPNSIRIYNCTSGNSLKWKEIEEMVFPLTKKYPSLQVFRYPGGKFKESRIYNQICTLVNHQIPAYLIDSFRWALGKKPILVRLYDKLHRAINALEYFTVRDWDFRSNNVVDLSQELKGLDQMEFPFSVKNINWFSYFHDYINGIREFILKEDNSSLDLARTKLNRIYYIQTTLYLLTLTILLYSLESCTSISQRLYSTIFESILPSFSTVWFESVPDKILQQPNELMTNSTIFPMLTTVPTPPLSIWSKLASLIIGFPKSIVS